MVILLQVVGGTDTVSVKYITQDITWRKWISHYLSVLNSSNVYVNDYFIFFFGGGGDFQFVSSFLVESWHVCVNNAGPYGGYNMCPSPKEVVALTPVPSTLNQVICGLLRFILRLWWRTLYLHELRDDFWKVVAFHDHSDCQA